MKPKTKSFRISLQSEVALSLQEAKIICDEDGNSPHPDYRQEAKKFLRALNGRWCVASLQALMMEIDSEIRRHWKKYSKERLYEYESMFGMKSLKYYFRNIRLIENSNGKFPQ